jgi:hypothetical protein
MTRTLKIENRGDSFHRETIPAIRLKGKWLHAMGFLPGNHVQVEVTAPGVMTLRMVQPLDAADFQNAIAAFARIGV